MMFLIKGAVCVDKGMKAWADHPFVKKNYTNVVHCCDGAGFAGSFPTQYHVYATPTMLLLNKNHEFLPLPKDLEALKKRIIKGSV